MVRRGSRVRVSFRAWRRGIEKTGSGTRTAVLVRFTTATAALTALVVAGGVATAPAASSHKLAGHYHGHNRGGRAVSFDVSGAKPKIKNFSIAVDVECWNDYNNDGQSDRLLAQITGFHGKVKKDGSFDIYYAPDDDTEFEFSGTLNKGKANVKALVGGTFDANGAPDPAGPYQCDSWGAKYRAKQG